MQSFCTVSESFANFWKSSRLHEISTKSAPGPGSPACVWAATSRVPGGPCPQLLPPQPAPRAPAGVASRGQRPLPAVPPSPRPPPRPSRGPFVCARARSRAPPRPLTCGRGHCEPEKEPQPRLHEPRSAAGAPGRRTNACGRERGLVPGTAGLALRLGGLRGRPLAGCVPGCGQELAATVSNFRARYPSRRRAGRLWAPALLLPAPPPSPPRPPEGLELPRRAFEPGAHGGRLAGAGEPARRRAGCDEWGPGQLPEGHTHTRAHTRIHTRALTLTRPPRRVAARTLQLPPQLSGREKRLRLNPISYLWGSGKQHFSPFT